MKYVESRTILPSLLWTVTLVCVIRLARADVRHDPTDPAFPKISLPGISHGQDAINRLGSDLPAVAESYGHTPDQLRNRLRSDQSLHVDETGRLLYIDEALPAEAALTGDSPVSSAAAPYPLANTFLLHSRAGSKRVIYLDFDGHVLSGTAWNSGTASTINCPPWDIDGNPSSFGDNERTIIQGIWQRVAEDYRPFDVDVTTEYPGEAAMTRTDSTDTAFGVRVLISAISSYFGAYGGIAYVGVFDNTGDYYKPALVFPENLGNSEKNIAEAAAHEAGHTLGLSHDGTTTGSAYYGGSGSGETGWAPIMGVGYYRNLSQWSKGEYANANNTEDDLAVMQNNGITYRADDHGNTIASASMLPAGTALNASGVIERNTDVDVFAFTTGAGTITINISPASNGPNLDVLAELYNASGVKIASSNPTGYLAASLNLSVSAGSYYLFVRGTGQGDPLTGYSNYASLGAYTVSGTVIGSASNAAPLAVVKATPQSGFTPLTVQFDGTGSSDPDGSISSYSWTFGDGTTGSGSLTSHTYSTAGTFTATLRVTDNGGSSSSSSLTITATAPTANQPPTAAITATPTSGSAPLVVTFSGSGSRDADGTIASYQWNYGDGTTGSGVTIQHTYQAAGNYTATLTVKDNLGASGSASFPISVQPSASSVMHVSAIALTSNFWSAWGNVTAVVTVLDSNGRAVSGATVTGNWSGGGTGSYSGMTDASGKLTVVSSNLKKGTTVTFTVGNVTKSGYSYSASQSVTSKSISL